MPGRCCLALSFPLTGGLASWLEYDARIGQLLHLCQLRRCIPFTLLSSSSRRRSLQLSSQPVNPLNDQLILAHADISLAHLFVLCNLYPNISSILRLQDLDDIRRQSLIPTFTNCHSILRLTLDHTPVEFIFVPERGFLSQFTDPILLRLVVSCSMDIILVFFEITEFLSMEELSSLSVISFRERILLSVTACPGWYYSLLFDVLTMMSMG
jgi:hypothetical protein